MNATTPFNPAIALADMVDELGTVKAEIAALQNREKILTDKLKLTGLTEIDGTLFRATVSTCERETVDTKRLRADLGDAIMAAYLVKTSVSTCRVNARKTS